MQRYPAEEGIIPDFTRRPNQHWREEDIRLQFEARPRDEDKVECFSDQTGECDMKPVSVEIVAASAT